MTPIVRLKRQLTLWYLALLAGVLVLFGVITYLAARATLFEGVDSANRSQLGGVLAAFERPEETLDDVVHELSELALDPDQHVAVLSPGRRPVYERGPLFDPEPVMGIGASTHGGYRFWVVAVERDGRVRGYLRIGRPLEGVERTLSTLRMSLLAGIPLALLLAGVGGMQLAGHAAKPMVLALERERRLTQDASHELRTPIAVVQAHVDLLLQTPDLSADVQAKLRLIRTTTQGMADLVADLLVLGRDDAGLGETPLRWSLADTLEEELSALMPLATEAGVRLEVGTVADLAWVQGDPQRLARAVRSLLHNAIRYTPRGGWVNVSLCDRRGLWVLTVSNQGPAISEDQRERIFERFARGPGARTRYPEGSGLGLPIARAIARAHGGDVVLEVASPHPTFVLTVPKG